jgi:hypothetical protein
MEEMRECEGWSEAARRRSLKDGYSPLCRGSGCGSMDAPCPGGFSKDGEAGQETGRTRSESFDVLWRIQEQRKEQKKCPSHVHVHDRTGELYIETREDTQ